MRNLFHSAYVDPVIVTKRVFTPPSRFHHPHYVHHRRTCIIMARRSMAVDATPNASRKSRRKTSDDVQRERKNRARSVTERRAIIAQWSGAVIAESSKYEFLDGRFFFPPSSVRWSFLEDSGKGRFFNPIGRAQLFDIVFRSQSTHKQGAVIARNRGAVIKLDGVKGGWKNMEGYTCFCKGVKLFQKPPAFHERVVPGQVRTPYHACGLPDECDRFDGFEYLRFNQYDDGDGVSSIHMAETKILSRS